jgi:beta-lactamase regulating signal transducer with metallopeptidase domain
MLDLAVRAFALLAAAAAAAPVLRRASPAVRHLYWHAVIVATLALPLASAVAPSWTVRSAPVVTDTVALVSASIDPAAGPARTGKSGASVPPPSSGRSNMAALTSVARATWLAGTAMVAVFFALGHVRVRQLRRAAKPAPLAWTADAVRIVARLRLRTAPAVLLSGDVPGPLATGWLTPVLLIPEAAEHWSASRREAVVAHELAHVARRDCRTQFVVQAVCALHWFNPFAWLAAARLQRERERACDAEVLRLGITPSTYAAELLAIASGFGHHRAPMAALAMARRSELEGRLLAVLAASRPGRSIAGRPISVAAVAALALLVAGARAGSQPREVVPTSHPVSAPPIVQQMATGGAAVLPAPPPASAVVGSDEQSAGVQAPAAAEPEAAAQTAALDGLLTALADPDAQVREKAAIVVGFWPDERAGDALIRALADPDAQVREKAAVGLALRRRPGAVGPLVAAMRDPDSQVREKAAIALGTTGGADAWTALSGALSDPDPQVREKAAAALLLLKTGSGLPGSETLPAVVRLGLRMYQQLFP